MSAIASLLLLHQLRSSRPGSELIRNLTDSIEENMDEKRQAMSLPHGCAAHRRTNKASMGKIGAEVNRKRSIFCLHLSLVFR